MLSTIEAVNSVVNNFIWGVPAMICIIGVGLYLSIRTRFLQIRKFPYSMKVTLEHVAMLEQTGQAFVIRPPIPLEIGSMERDPAQLRRVYDTGRAVAEIQVDKIAAFVEQSRAAE